MTYPRDEGKKVHYRCRRATSGAWHSIEGCEGYESITDC